MAAKMRSLLLSCLALTATFPAAAADLSGSAWLPSLPYFLPENHLHSHCHQNATAIAAQDDGSRQPQTLDQPVFPADVDATAPEAQHPAQAALSLSPDLEIDLSDAGSSHTLVRRKRQVHSDEAIDEDSIDTRARVQQRRRRLRQSSNGYGRRWRTGDSWGFNLNPLSMQSDHEADSSWSSSSAAASSSS